MIKFYKLLTALILLSINFVFAQNSPHIFSNDERKNLPEYNALRNGTNQINTGTTTPPASPVRTIGEW